MYAIQEGITLSKSDPAAKDHLLIIMDQLGKVSVCPVYNVSKDHFMYQFYYTRVNPGEEEIQWGIPTPPTKDSKL